MTRHFTVEEANRTLPLVSRIVRDILEHYAAWQRAVEAFEVANADRRSAANSAETEPLQRAAQALAQEIQGFLRELADIGVEFKGFEQGLVDFPGVVEGRAINWCWRYGEASVQYWHEVDAGFEARQPIEAIALAGAPNR
jgi:hypothetical protein